MFCAFQVSWGAFPWSSQVTFLSKLLSGPDEVIVDDPNEAQSPCCTMRFCLSASCESMESGKTATSISVNGRPRTLLFHFYPQHGLTLRLRPMELNHGHRGLEAIPFAVFWQRR